MKRGEQIRWIDKTESIILMITLRKYIWDLLIQVQCGRYTYVDLETPGWNSNHRELLIQIKTVSLFCNFLEYQNVQKIEHSDI